MNLALHIKLVSLHVNEPTPIYVIWARGTLFSNTFNTQNKILYNYKINIQKDITILNIKSHEFII